MRVFAVLVCGQGSVTLRPSVSREVGVLDFKGLPSSESIISSARSMNSSVMLWRLLEREADWLPPWRDLLRVYRRLEARGDIRGGRFVSGAGRRLDQQFLEGDRQSSGDAETHVGKCQAGHGSRRFGSVNEGIGLHRSQHYTNCPYCIASHTASARGKGMTDEQFAELLAVIGLANDTNRVAIGYGVPIDDRFQTR